MRSRRYLSKCYNNTLKEGCCRVPEQHAVRIALVQLIQRPTGDDSAGLSLEEREHVVGEALDARILVVLLIEVLVMVSHALVRDIRELQHEVVHGEYSG